MLRGYSGLCAQESLPGDSGTIWDIGILGSNLGQLHTRQAPKLCYHSSPRLIYICIHKDQDLLFNINFPLVLSNPCSRSQLLVQQITTLYKETHQLSQNKPTMPKPWHRRENCHMGRSSWAVHNNWIERWESINMKPYRRLSSDPAPVPNGLSPNATNIPTLRPHHTKDE